MTKDEALKKAFKQAFQLGQDYWYQADHEFESQNKKSDVTRAKFEQLMEDAIKEALAQPELNYKKALEVWLDKTEWVQETVKPHELGMHRADVLKQRIEKALAQPEQDSCYGYKGKCNRVMSDGNPCGLTAPCPDCGLSLIDCPKPQPWEKFCDSNCVWTDHHPDCKLAQRKPLTDEEIWVLTSEYNDYDQHGEYFEAVFIGKPTAKQIQKHCLVGEKGAVHILNGGGRVKYEDQWYNLRKEKAAHGITREQK